MKKRIVALLLCCVMLLTLSPSLIASASADDENTVIEQTKQTEPKNEESAAKKDESAPASDTDAAAKDEPKTETKDEAKAETKDEVKDETKAETKDEVKDEAKEEQKPADEPAPAPTVVPVVEQNVPVASEIVYPTVNFTDVAPFLNPVSGSSVRRVARNVATQANKDDGISLSKTATANKDGSYTITLESYATGSSTTTTVKEDIPTDIILLLDTSGSMSKKMTTVSYQAYTNTQNSNLYYYRHNENGNNGNLWYKIGDNSYASVSVTIEKQFSYTKITSGKNDSTKDGATNYWDNRNSLYTYVNGEIKKVVYTRERNNLLEKWNCKYALEDGTILNRNNAGSRYSPIFQNTDDGFLYLATVNENQTRYTYTYTDANGVAQTIGTSTGANTNFTTATLYRKVTSSNSITRLNALKNAVNAFADSVAEKAKGANGQYGGGDDIEHRIAVVEFTDSAWNRTNGLVRMDTANGLTTVKSVVNNLGAGGNTAPATALNMANSIFSQNPVETGKRNRVIVLFTDGYPAEGGTDNINYGWCDNAIASAYTSKNTYGATVYTVGIFDGADPTSDINANFEYGNRYNSTFNTKQLVAANRYMHYTSSNFQDAKSLRDGGSKTKDGYYLSASDADSLNSIFQQISGNISTGGSSTTLDSSAVIRDIIAPQFELPANATKDKIELYTAESDGSTDKWKARSHFDGNVEIDKETGEIAVSGFSFKDNWCGNETVNGNTKFHDGKKLIIEFTVQPKAGFLGGNDVYTNEAKSGIYEKPNSNEPLDKFPQPTANVKIPEIAVSAAEKNVYLLGSVSGTVLKADANVTFGTDGKYKIDLSKADDENNPYGLEPWQTAYVNITATIKDKATGNAVTDFNNLVDDKEYTITVTVTPKTEGTTTPEKGEAATAKTGVNNPAGKINVFKPEVTFKDSQITLGETANYEDNKPVTNFEVWKHGTTLSTAAGVTMIGTAPELTYTYAPTADDFQQDTPVKVSAVKIDDTVVTSHVTFKHQPCGVTGCKWETVKDNAHFIVHVKSLSLKISKTYDNMLDPNQSAVFEVTGPNGLTFEVVIHGKDSVTINGLPTGEYTVTEKNTWTWRYTDTTEQTVELKANDTTVPTVKFENKTPFLYWLTGGTYCDNRFDGKNTTITPASN